MRRRAFALLSLLLLSIPPHAAAEPTFSAARIRADVAFLADDLLEGRKSGTRGYDLAARYVATRFEALGLTPPGGGSWYQPVPLAAARPVRSPAPALHIGARTFEHKSDVLVGPSFFEPRVDATLPVVFAGYCIDAPDQGGDDFAGLDVRGKAVACLTGFPKGMASDVGAQLASRKSLMAQERGAIATLSVYTRSFERVLPWARMLEMAEEPTTSWVQADGTPYRLAPRIRHTAMLHGAASEALFAGAPRALAAILDEADREGGRPRGFALPAPVRIRVASETQRFDSPNVVALLPGSDPQLAREVVVLVAHLDHMGVAEGAKGREVMHGAIDNALGVATMLEVARALAEAPRRPARSVLFAAVTAEEMGLLGSQYLAKHPVVRGAASVAVVCLDAPILLYDFTDVIAFGGEHSTLGPAIARAIAAAGVRASPDPMPEQAVFVRSDHFSFVKEGVPGVFLVTGFANGGDKGTNEYLQKHYHRASDDLALPIDWQAAAKFARINYLIARDVAEARERPLWYEDSPFGKTYAPGAPKAKRQES